MLKLASISDRFQEVEKKVGDPEVIADQRAYRDLMREYKRLEPIVIHYAELKAWEADAKQAAKEAAEAKAAAAAEAAEAASEGEAAEAAPEA